MYSFPFIILIHPASESLRLFCLILSPYFGPVSFCQRSFPNLPSSPPTPGQSSGRWCERGDSCVYLGSIGSIDESWSRDVYAKQMDGSSLLDASRPTCSLVKVGERGVGKNWHVDGGWWTHSGEKLILVDILWTSDELQCFDHPNWCWFLEIQCWSWVKAKWNGVDRDRLIDCSVARCDGSPFQGLGCLFHLIKNRLSMAIQPAMLSYHFIWQYRTERR